MTATAISPHSHGLPSPQGPPVQSRAERRSSFDVADFAIPNGREEEWRFTPMDRLRGLHLGAEARGRQAEVTVDARDGVRVETVERGDPRLGRCGIPEDRVAAQADRKSVV